MSQEFTIEQRKALHKIELLLKKADGNANEHEAAVATQLAQDLLARYNLDMEALGNGGATEGERQKIQFAGGFFDWERDLWQAIAELNWCWYFSDFDTGIHKGHNQTRVHRVIGRKVNILSTRMMAEYLTGATNRLAKEYCLDQVGRYHNRSAMATSFRKGATERLIGKLRERRWEVLQEERQREAEAKARGDSSGVALAVTRLSASEYERNYDFTYGEGAYARSQIRLAQYTREAEERKAREKAWRLANPEEAARLDREAEEQFRKDQEKWERSQSRRKERDPASDMGAYEAGYDQAEDISLDKQVEAEKAKGLLSD